MRILLWHGYLLGGTGSNVYTRQLAREWSSAGHDVTVLSQEPNPEQYDLGGAEVVRPDVGGLLPVFVLDRYEGYEVKLLQDCTREELDAWVAANADAVRKRLPADLVFANHVLLGGPVAAATGARYAVKAHGSELEYSMRGRPELETWGREALAGADAVFVGSAHIREVLEDVVGHVDRVHEVPPGVDVDTWRPQPREEALASLLAECRADSPNPGNADERRPDEGNAERLEAFLRRWPPDRRLLREAALEQGSARAPRRATLNGLGGDRRAARHRRLRRPSRSTRVQAADPERALFTGPLEHRHLVHLLALADACVVPSIFPEAFGMVAAEAAAAGCPPLVARHSGLAEIAVGLEAEYPPAQRHLTSFATGDADDLRAKLTELLALPPDEREAVSAAARRAAEERWSWASVAERLLLPGGTHA